MTIRDPGERPAPRPTILAVDDSRANLAVLGTRLEELGYRALLSAGGRDALAQVAAGGVDLVLLDHVMPGMSGVDVLAELRGRRETADIPVIVMTGRSTPAAAVEALAAGADDWIAKPFAFEMLAARIARTLARAKRPGTAQADRPASTADRNRLVASIQALDDAAGRLAARD
jgi:DNA-binding response OmpR family regulator